eukprot:1195666-Prorocentrum_minimum.AAC.1
MRSTAAARAASAGRAAMESTCSSSSSGSGCTWHGGGQSHEPRGNIPGAGANCVSRGWIYRARGPIV